MTFSPEDAYASNLPIPDEDKFNTDGLELAPLDGEEVPVEIAPAAEEVYTEEQQAADAELYSVTTKDVKEGGEAAAEDPEKLQEAEDKLKALMSINPDSWGFGSEAANLKKELLVAISELADESQVSLAEKTNDNLSDLTGRNVDTKLQLIAVLGQTKFGQTLRGLEDGRLKRAGYGGLK